MSIEKDIQQSKFRNEYHKTVVNLIFTYNWITEKTKQFFDKGDITSQQYNILRILKGSGRPLSTMQIRERMLDRMSDTSRIIDRMVAKGIVEKKPNDNDKRLVDITITTKGMYVLGELDKQNHKLESIVSNLLPHEAEMLNDLLDKMRGE